MADTQAAVNKRRKQRRRRIIRKRIFTAFIVLLLIAAIVMAILSLTVLFPVKNVTATGSKLYTSAQIVKASGLGSDDNIFTFSEKEVEESIHKILPYVDTVKISRTLPDSVKLTVTDAKEYESYLVDGKYYAVSKNGYVLNQYNEQPEGTFLTVCEGVSCKIGYKIEFKDDNSSELVAAIKENLEKEKININSIDVSDKYDIVVGVEGRFEVFLGEESNLKEKIAHLGSMIESIGENRAGTINLTMWTSQKSEGTFTEKQSEAAES